MGASNGDMRIGISLSGGGVRAAVFHFGVLGRLAREGKLENIKFISSVSGGTLGTGLIFSLSGNRWPTSTEYIEKIEPELRRIMTHHSLQVYSILQLLLRLWYLLRSRAKLLSISIEKLWNITGLVKNLPDEPRWIINATTFETSKNYRFMNKRMGDYIINYTIFPDIKIADAMAASAGYPGAIGPLKLDCRKYQWIKINGNNEEPVDPRYSKVTLWDGGVYDNLGVEALFKIGEQYRDEINYLIVSDASPRLPEVRRGFIFRNTMRLLLIAMDQVRNLRSRAIVKNFEQNKNSGAYIRIGNSAKEILQAANTPGEITEDLLTNVMSKEDIERAANYKTTLRKLKPEDYNVLYQHGWEVANYTFIAYSSELFNQMDTGNTAAEREI